MIQELLEHAQTELATLAVIGLANAGPAMDDLDTLADELTAARLGKLGDRLRAVAEASDRHSRTAAWAAAWTGVGLVHTRLLKPQTLDIGDALALPQAPAIRFPRPQGDLESLDGLLDVLQGSDMLARAYAADRLAELGNEAVPGLLAVQKTCGRCIRFLAIDALGCIGTDEALAVLIGLLGDRDVARPLEKTLLSLGERIVAPAAEALANTRGAKTRVQRRRRAAAKLLWRIEAAERLQSCLDDGDKLVKAYAQAALWSNNCLAKQVEQQSSAAGIPAAAVLFEHNLMTVASLIEQLDAVYKNYLADAAAVLWHTPAEHPLLAHYLAQMTEGRRKKEREWAAAVVMHLANPEALGALLPLLDADANLAVAALAELADEATVWPLLQTLARWGRPSRKDPIVSALGRLGDPAAVPTLLKALKETPWPWPWSWRRDAVEKALIAIGAPATGAVGQALLHLEPAPQTVAPALERVLEKIKTPEAKAALQAYRAETDEVTQLLRHLADNKSAKQAVDQIARLGEDALEPLLKMVEGDNTTGQKNAALALSRLAPTLPEEQHKQIIQTLTSQLAEQKHQGKVGKSWQGNTVAEALVRSLCRLSRSNFVGIMHLRT